MAPDSISANDAMANYKREFIIWAWSVFLSVACCAAVSFLFTQYTVPNLASVLAKALSVSINSLYDFRPEPTEKILFFFNLVFLPLLLTAFYCMLNQCIKGNGRAINIMYLCTLMGSICGLAVLLSLGLTTRSDVRSASTPFQVYFAGTFPAAHPFFYSLLFFPSVLLLFYWAVAKKNFITETTMCMTNRILFAFYFLLISFLCLINIFDVNAVNWLCNCTKFIYTRHLNAVLYSVTQVYAGQPLLVDSFYNNYGLYPYFLNPIFQVVGLSVLNFTVLMGILIGLSFLFLLIVMQRTIKNKAIVFLGFTTIVFWKYLLFAISEEDYLFQQQPLRTFFPSLILLLAVCYVENKNKILYYCLFAICSLASLWNPESGINAYGAWLMLLCYLELPHLKLNIKVMIRNMVRHLLAALSISALVFLAINCIVRTTYGCFPSWRMLFSLHSACLDLGNLMLPMPLFHPWNIIVLVYLIGLLFSIRACVHRHFTPRSAIVFLISILGIGTFPYYVGRSHDFNLVAVSTYFFVLISIFADELLELIKKYGMRSCHNVLLFAPLMYILSFSCIGLFHNIPQLYNLFMERNKLFGERSLSPTERNIQFIKKYVTRGERVIILSENQGVYFAATNTSSAFQPGLVELFFRKDHERLVKVLKNSCGLKVFIDSHIFTADINPRVKRDAVAILMETYELIDTNSSISYFQKK